MPDHRGKPSPTPCGEARTRTGAAIAALVPARVQRHLRLSPMGTGSHPMGTGSHPMGTGSGSPTGQLCTGSPCCISSR